MPSTQATKPRSSKTAPRKTQLPLDKVQDTLEAPQPETTISDAEKREALIRIAAYSFYERRGYVSGHELEDWLQAEMEVDRQLGGAQGVKQTG